MADYCTTAQIKDAGRLNITGSAYDTAMGLIVTAASRWIDRATWQIDDAFAASATASRYYVSGDSAGKRLWLDAPIISVSTLTNGDAVAIGSGDYRLAPRNARYYWFIDLKSTSTGWAFATDGEIEVAGVWGFSTTVPDPIREATAMLAGWMFKRYQSALQDNAASPEFGSIIYGESIPKQVMALILPYTRGPV